MKKSRVSINTNLYSYTSFLFSFLNKNKNKIKFLTKLKKFLKSENLLLTSQGRVAIYLVAKCLVKKNKNEFIASPYTLNEALNAIKYAGGKIKFVDIDVNTGLPQINELKSKINNKTCGVLITHLYASKKNLKNFFQVFKKQTIIEDTAINFGARLSRTYLGTLGDFGIYSFGTMKNLCLFNGGLIYCKDNKNYKKIEKIENNLKKYPYFVFIQKVLLAMIIDIAYNKYIYSFFTHYLLKIIYKYEFRSIIKIIYPGLFPKKSLIKPENYNYRFQPLVSKCGINLLKSIKNDHEIRIKKAKLYDKFLNNEKLIKKFKFQDFKENSFLEYPILCKKDFKMPIVKNLFINGYDVRYKWYIDNSTYFGNKYFKNSKHLESNMLCLPTNKNFSFEDIKKICFLINGLNDAK